MGLTAKQEEKCQWKSLGRGSDKGSGDHGSSFGFTEMGKKKGADHARELDLADAHFMELICATALGRMIESEEMRERIFA